MSHSPSFLYTWALGWEKGKRGWNYKKKGRGKKKKKKKNKTCFCLLVFFPPSLSSMLCWGSRAFQEGRGFLTCAGLLFLIVSVSFYPFHSILVCSGIPPAPGGQWKKKGEGENSILEPGIPIHSRQNIVLKRHCLPSEEEKENFLGVEKVFLLLGYQSAFHLIHSVFYKGKL